MGPVYEHFKFKIGDFVQQKVSADHQSRKMQVIERMYQECPGGVQLHALCRQIGGASIRFIECELEPYAQNAAELRQAKWDSMDIEDRLMMRARRAEERRKASEETQPEGE